MNSHYWTLWVDGVSDGSLEYCVDSISQELGAGAS